MQILLNQRVDRVCHATNQTSLIVVLDPCTSPKACSTTCRRCTWRESSQQDDLGLQQPTAGMMMWCQLWQSPFHMIAI